MSCPLLLAILRRFVAFYCPFLYRIKVTAQVASVKAAFLKVELKQIKAGYYDCLDSRFDLVNKQAIEFNNTLIENNDLLNEVKFKM